MTALIAQVAIEQTAYHFDKPYDYLVPESMTRSIQVGARASVPFGRSNRKRVGVVVALTQGEVAEGLKPIFHLLDETPLLSQEMVELAFWLKNRTFCTLYDALKAMLPAGIQLKMLPAYALQGNHAALNAQSLTEDERQIVEYLQKAGAPVMRERLLQALGLSKDCELPDKLCKDGLLIKSDRPVQRLADATVRAARLLLTQEEARDSGLRLTPKQRAVFDLLCDVGTASVKEICYFTGVGPAVVQALQKKRVLELYDQQVYRTPASAGAGAREVVPIVLNAEQQRAYDSVMEDIRCNRHAVSLLFGVTGSGKTQVYMKLMEQVSAQGRGVIVMVPEISLTPQTISLFQARFAGQVAIFHSGLSVGERMDEWKRVKSGQALIAVGTRSAVFAPFDQLGLIIMDEEQEHTYKSEAAPRFHARDVARFRAAWHHAPLVLASATPAVESYSNALQGRYRLLRLQQRFGKAELPVVETVDMREMPPGVQGVLSPKLLQELRQNLEKGNQSILLLNRRGYHTFVSCRKCGHVLLCPNCSISLTYHAANGRMMCHYCGHSEPVSRTCPACGGEQIRFAGIGTQLAEDELHSLLPGARVLRMDADSTLSKGAYEERLNAFYKQEYDVMLGTQMVAKGLDFPKVTLVGVLNADQAIYNDDYRSYERAFALLTQVVGRAGRGELPGKAVIQTIAPDHEVIELARRQDYEGFFEQELMVRKLMEYPPYCDICLVGFVGQNQESTELASHRFFELLRQRLTGEYSQVKVKILGPAPAQVVKVNHKFRYRMIIKCKNRKDFRQMMAECLTEFGKIKEHKDITVYIDNNPDGML